MASRPAASDRGLVRVLGRWDLTAVGVNQIIGSGIFVLPASVALLVGAAASLWPFILAGIANTLIVLCFAEAGTRFRGAGGPYLYAREAFGPLVGFEVAWMLWLTRVASQAALANALALYLGYFWPGATSGAGRVLVVTATIGALAAINYRGIRQGSWTVNLFTVGKLLPLLAFVFAGLFFVDWTRFGGMGAPGGAGTLEAILLLMFAFGGYELVTLPAGEARSPRRDVPRALLTSIVTVTLIYLLVQLVAAGTLPGLEASETPLADSARRFMGPVAGVLVAIGGLLSIAGSNAGTMLAGPRITFALGERGQLPALFGRVHPGFRTPDFSIAVYSVVSLVLALSGTFEQMAKVSALARLVFYVTTCAAVPVLRRRLAEPVPQPGISRAEVQLARPFKLPGGPTIPILAVAGALAIVFGADRVSLLSGAAALLIGGLLYVAQSRRRVT